MELSLKDIRELIGGTTGTTSTELPFNVGDKLFIRTVTYHVTGEVVKIVGKFLVMKNAAWIADSGRFMDALKSEQFSEVEPFTNEIFLNTDSITDATLIKSLPTTQK